MDYAIETIKNYLSHDKRYEITHWNASNSSDNNIIKGVLKEGKPIMILIRPTNGNKIIFHKEQEKNVLMDETSELWGCSNEDDIQLITFGKVLKWNNINQIVI